MYFYSVCGLTVASEIDLPGQVRHAAPRPSEVMIRLGGVPQHLDGDVERGPTWERTGEQFLLCIPDLARFLVEGGRMITVATEGATDVDDIVAFLTGSVFGILLHQRRRIVLHASAVLVNGRAVLFCGASGAGKSTLAAALGQRGYALVSDDMAALTFDTGKLARIQPNASQLKLWSRSIAALSLGSRRGAAVRSALEKYHVSVAALAPEPVPVGALYTLAETRPPLITGITSANVVDASQAVLRYAYRPRLVALLGQRADYFAAGATMADRVPVSMLVRPLEFAALDQTIDALERHWSEIGLLP